MDMLLSTGFLDMKPMELEDVSGGALNGMQIMYVSPSTAEITTNTTSRGFCLSLGSAFATRGVVTVIAGCITK